MGKELLTGTHDARFSVTCVSTSAIKLYQSAVTNSTVRSPSGEASNYSRNLQRENNLYYKLKQNC